MAWALSSRLPAAVFLIQLLFSGFTHTLSQEASNFGKTLRVGQWIRGPRCGTGDSNLKLNGSGKGVGRSHGVTLYVALSIPSESLLRLETTFWQVSDPEHRKFRKFLSRDELSALLNVSDVSRNNVIGFLNASSSEGPISVSPYGDVVQASIGCKQAEAMFGIEMHEFTHTLTGTTVMRSHSKYMIPSHLKPFIRHISGLNDFPMRRMRLQMGSQKAAASERYDMIRDNPWNTCKGSCKGSLVPSVLRDEYGIPSQTAQASMLSRERDQFEVRSNSSRVDTGMAVAEFSSNWCQEGLDRFKSDCGLNTSLKVDVMVGSNSPGICHTRHGGYTCAEAMLDITYIKALASDVKLTDIFQGGHFSIQEWAMELAKMSENELPLVHSISFGEDETELESVGYMNACNIEFQKLGLRGVSLLFASGDQGVWGRTGYNRKVFSPDFPSTSPYVTSVGGTTLATAGTTGKETSWDSSGGGFSNIFGRPPYQEKAVSEYLSSSNLPDQKYWNRTGRAYPDVSALAGGENGYCVSVAGDDFNAFTGTSASTPVWSAVVALLNSIRLSRGDPPLGFLNPILYANPTMFTDIVSGSNDAGTGNGFNATKGFDPCTGLGTIDYDQLAGILLQRERQ